MTTIEILERCGGIAPGYEIFYIECIDIALDSAIKSYVQLNHIINDSDFNGGVLIAKELINLAENIITQSAILSKYFKPPTNNRIHLLRSKRLREMYAIEDDNLILNRDFRNHIEHFDEKLDRFLNPPDPFIGTLSPFCLLDQSSDLNNVAHVFRAYVLNEEKYISLNETFEINPIMKEIDRLKELNVKYMKQKRF